MDRAKAIEQLQAYAGAAIPYRFKRDILNIDIHTPEMARLQG